MSGGFSYPNPTFDSPIYNPVFYLSLDSSGFLTYNYAQTLYISKNDYRLSYLTGLTPGIASSGGALIAGSNNDITGLGAIECKTINIVDHDGGMKGLSLGGTLITASASELNYVDTSPGIATASKALVLDSSSFIRFPSGSTGSNSIKFYGTNANKEQYHLFRDSDDNGVTIGSTIPTIDKASFGLRIFSGYATPGTGTSSTGSWAGLVLTNKLVNLSTTYTTSINEGYLLSTQQWGTNDYAQISTNHTALNICCNDSSSTYAVSGCNILIDNNGRYAFNDTIPSDTYQCTFNGTSSYSGLEVYGKGTLLELNNNLGAGSDKCSIVMRGGNFSQWEIAIGGNSHSTVANGMFWYSGGYRMVLTSAGRLGIGTTSPVCPMHVATNNSYTWGAGTLNTIYRLRTDSGVTESATAPITYTNLSAYFNGYINCEAMVMNSDRRLKRDLEPVPIGRVRGLYEEIEVKRYRWKKSPERLPELGLISQDLLECGFMDLVEQVPNSDPNLQESTDDLYEPKGVQLSVNYSKLAVYNMRMIQEMIREIADLKEVLLRD